MHVAVSGGADSVCLFLVMAKLKDELGIELEVIHVEHGIRGEESKKDADFVRKLCEREDVKYTIFNVDAPKVAKERKISLEEAARELRYQCFNEVAKEGVVAVAHHMEDNAETVLFNMSRGSGIDGMCGISPVRDNIIRPFINVSRTDIESYLEEKQQNYCVDRTNQEDKYTRNYIRHNVLPLLENVNSKSIDHINQMALELNALSNYLSKQVEEKYIKYVDEEGVSCELLEEDEVIVSEVIHNLLCSKAKTSKDISRVHVEAVVDLLKNGAGREIHLPYGLVAVSKYGRVDIRTNEEEIKECERVEQVVDISSMKVGEKQIIKVLDYVFEIELNLKEDSVEIEAKNYTKTFDYDKINGCFCIRNRKEGDFLTINDDGAKKSLKKYMIDEKIPRGDREQKILLCCDNHVLWVVDHRISAYFKVTDETKRLLKVTVRRM